MSLDTNALVALLAKSLESSPEAKVALLAQLAAVQPAPVDTTPAYREITKVELTPYLTLRVGLRRAKPKQGKKPGTYVQIHLDNPKRERNGEGAYGSIWLYRAEFTALCNWFRGDLGRKAHEAALAGGITDAA